MRRVLLLPGAIVGHRKHTIAHLIEHINVAPQEMEHSYGIGHNQSVSLSHRRSLYFVRLTERTAPLELLDDGFFFFVVFFFSGFFSVFFFVVVDFF